MNVPWSGAVLAGGRARRFGADKAYALVDGTTLVGRSAACLHAAGAAEVFVVGGDRVRLAAEGLTGVSDIQPDAGPLGGVLGALAAAQHPVVVIVACDLPRLAPSTVVALVAELHAAPEQLAVVPVVDGLAQWHVLALWQSAGALLEEAFAGGARAVHHAMRDVPVGRVDVGTVDEFADVDTPEDLARYASVRRSDRDAPR